MNVLFLDDEQAVKSRFQSFLKKGESQADWQPVFASRFDGSVPPDQWMEELFDKVIRAEAIVCFGDYLIFHQLGDFAQKLVDMLIDKARSGVPFLLHFVRYAENESNYERAQQNGDKPVTESLRELFKAFDVRASEIKVDMTLTHTPYNRSSSIGYFRKSDGALRDPYLFKGVGQILVSTPNLINFAGEAFPIIDASEAVNSFVDRGDRFTAALEGTIPAVGVVRQPGDEYQLILSGSYLADPTEVLAGPIPGIDENQEFADNVISALSGAAKTSNNIQQKCYALFNRLERSLGKLILDVIPKNNLSHWISQRTRDALMDDGQLRYENANFGNLCHIVKDNWTSFQRRFNGVGKQEVLNSLFGVAKGPRLLLAHPHRAEQEDIRFSEEDAAVLQEALNIIKQASDQKT